MGLPQSRLPPLAPLLLEHRGMSEGGASLPSPSGWRGAPVIGLDVAASEGGAKSQNTWGWMDGWMGRWEGRGEMSRFVSDDAQNEEDE